MPTYNGDKRVFLTEDRVSTVEEGSPKAAHLLVAPGQPISAEDADRYGVKTGDVEAPSLLEREQEGLKAAEARGATEEARARRVRVTDLEADEKAKTASANKARTSAPENKGR